jgi:hypothetical protein
MSRLLGLIGLMTILFSCASRTYVPHYDPQGEVGGDVSIEETAMDMKDEDVKGVKAYLNKFPEGLTINEEGAFVIKDEEKYELLGKVYTYLDNETSASYIFGNFYRYPEDQGWRRYYCYWQDPITWLTLGLWNAMPLYYPCFTSESNIPHDKLMRKRRIIQMLKKITKAAGGDLVVITSLGELKSVTVEMSSMPTDLEMFAAEGYAVKLKQPAKMSTATPAVRPSLPKVPVKKTAPTPVATP